MKVFVTGSNGFVGSYIVNQLLQDGHEVFASSRTGDSSSFNSNKNYRFIQVDFSDPFSLHDAFEFVQPDVVVHCGAMSKPDECELNQSDAFDANVFGTVQLLLNAETYKSFFVHLSSDFIFNGEKGMHLEEDKPDPISYYGKTKLQAEEAVMEYQHDWAIVRTVFVYGKPFYGRDSFITMIAKKLKNNEPFKVVNDQIRTPTHAEDLAKGIVAIVNKRATGVYNLAGKRCINAL
ncbi:SDR family oxidoreductase [Niabella ginsengisoli]|uniref:dTDP-4-dehydrorhamnose reductase n=1 Tax=Niabella ginsengisoli TaxID=522298 RepID=A0ABS9SQU4_9BACT|nr:SDR family oxidoreductase [Niabella ginsengisoli]MCH5600737.1 SDR family oxidoreductase [Niabella ginsengisoli]